MKSIFASLPGGLAVGASVTAILVAAAGVYRWSASWYRRTVGSRRDLTSRLNQLAAGVTTRWVEERLGTPAFVRRVNLGTADVGREARTELIHRTPARLGTGTGRLRRRRRSFLNHGNRPKIPIQDRRSDTAPARRQAGSQLLR